MPTKEKGGIMKTNFISTQVFHPNWQTICLVVKNHQVLLALKKRGFGKGKWNGTGGKPNPGEIPPKTAVRETKEEIRIIPRNLCHTADLRFRLVGIPEIYVHVFITDAFTGIPAETEEMAPRWFGFNEIPYDKMWNDDRHWLPKILARKFVSATFWFNKQNQLAHHRLITTTFRIL